MDNILYIINDYAQYIILALVGISLLFLMLLIVLMVKLANVKKKYNKFMEGSDSKSLEEIVLNKVKEISLLKDNVDNIKLNIKEIEENQKEAYQKLGLVKYNAFKEMGGKLSFSLALLNEKNDGFLINSMHSREGCYSYIKHIDKGISQVQLSDEEKEALSQALKQ